MKALFIAFVFFISFNAVAEGSSKDINLVQKQYDWQFSESKGKDTIVSIVKREAGGRVAITAKNQYFLIYNWNEIKSKAIKGIELDPGPYGIYFLMVVPKEILSGNKN